MRKLLVFASLFIFTIALAAMSEDLGALAKKEKARREALEKKGIKAKTLTNADVANIKAQLAYQQSTSSDQQDQQQTADKKSADTVSGEATAANEQTNDQNQNAENDQKLKELNAEKEQLQQQIDDARQAVGTGGIFHTVNVGNQYGQVSEAETKLKEIDKQIQDLQSQQQNQEGQSQQKPE